MAESGLHAENWNQNSELLVMSRHNSIGFWYVADCDAPFRGVVQVDRDTRDLRKELAGQPIAREWRPPPYKIVGSGKWPDWMGFWMPLLSVAGVSAIGDMLEGHCEFLQWINERQHDYSIINVLTKIPRQYWTCQESSSHHGQLASADIISLRGVGIPPIFTLDGYPSRVFVSSPLAQRSVEAGLTGVVFVDPRVRSLHVPFIQKRMKIRPTGFIHVEDDL